MIKIEFDTTTILVPQSWDEITLGEYEEWSRLATESREDRIRYVAAICKTDYDKLIRCPNELFEMIVSKLSFVFDAQIEPSATAVVDGQKYFVSYGEKLTLGEWVDVDSVLNDENPHYLSDTLGILCRLAGEDYQADLSSSRAELFRSQNCSQMLPLIAFFLHRKIVFDKISNHYSEALALAEQFVQDTDRFVRNGVGIKRLPIWQRIRYIFLMRSLRKRLSKFSASYSIASTSRAPKTISSASNVR